MRFTRIVVVQICIASLLIFGFLMGRAIFESKAEFTKAQKEEKRDQFEEAIHHYDRSIHWYAPFNPYGKKSLSGLWDLGKSLEKVGQERVALLAYDAMRGSIHAVRSFYWPYQSWLPKTNERIAILRAKEQTKGQTKGHPNVFYEEALTFHRRVLTIDERPIMGWTIFAEVGFLGWIFAVIGLIWKGFDQQGQMHFKRSLPWITSVIILFSFWLLGLVNA